MFRDFQHARSFEELRQFPSDTHRVETYWEAGPFLLLHQVKLTVTALWSVDSHTQCPVGSSHKDLKRTHFSIGTKGVIGHIGPVFSGIQNLSVYWCKPNTV